MNKDYTIEVLDANNKQMLEDAADCIAKTFVGVQVGTSFIQEPMTTAVGLSEEGFKQFNLSYFEAIASQGLTMVAIDNETKQVIGVVAAENFDPEEEIPVFEGEVAPFNEIYKLLMELDERYLETVHSKGEVVKSGEYLHLFMAGVRRERKKGVIATEMVAKILEIAKSRGFIAAFGEATNPRSQKMLRETFGFEVAKDNEGKDIETKYKETEAFKSVPEHVSPSCQFMFKFL